MDLRKSIFRYLHSVFNTDPNEVPILSVSFSDELDYRIHETTLTLGDSTIDLTDKTIGEVESDIRALGHAVDLLRPDLAHRHAVSLVDTHGTATGVLLHAQDSELWAVGMQGALEFLRTREAMEQALRQLNFMQANGGWIDLWGRYFDVPRLELNKTFAAAGPLATFIGDMAGWLFWPGPDSRLPYMDTSSGSGRLAQFRSRQIYGDIVQGTYTGVCSSDVGVIYLVGHDNSIRVSNDAGATWITQTPAGYVGGGHALTCSGSGAVALVRDVGQFFFTTDYGASWAQVADITGYLVVGQGYCVSQDGTYLAVCAHSQAVDGFGQPLETGLIASIDSGTTWGFLQTPGEVWELACSENGQRLLAEYYTGSGIGIALSTNSGGAWSDITAGVIGAEGGYVAGVAISADGSVLLVGGELGPRLSSDAGATWTLVNPSGMLTDAFCCAMSMDGSTLMVGTPSGVYVYSGLEWESAATATVDREYRYNQADPDYSAFIRREVLRTRSNGLSIQVAVKDWTSKTVIIREPWRELWIWDKSRFDSADARWQDGNFYTFGTIEPRGAIPESDWADITPVIQRNRSMGCYLLPHAFGVEAPKLSLGEINVGTSIALVHSSLIDASLDPSVAVGRHQDSYMTITLAGESSVWVGSWDSRTWSSGGRTYPVGYSRTDIPV